MSLVISQSSRRYQERRGVIPTLRLPTARSALSYNKINTFPLDPPYPLTVLTLPLTGSSSPDKPQAEVWPFGVP